MTVSGFERALKEFGYTPIPDYRIKLVRSRTPIRIGQSTDPLCLVLAVLPYGIETLNHTGEGPYVGVVREDSLNYDLKKRLETVNETHINQFSMTKGEEHRVVRVSHTKEKKLQVGLICTFPNDTNFRFNSEGIFDERGNPLDSGAQEVETRLFS